MTNTTAVKDRASYRRIPPEPWGRRLGRARWDLAHLTLSQAAALAGHWMLTTDSTISRLEGSDDLPSGPRNRSRRQLAYILCMAYMVDPADFGLTPEDLPPGLRVTARTPGEQAELPTIWTTVDAQIVKAA